MLNTNLLYNSCMKKAVVILNSIRSIHNVGSIFRTAAAAGVEKIYLCGITPSPLDCFGKVRSQFAKVSLGGERYVAWEKAGSALKTIDRLRVAGFKIFAVEQSRKAISYYRATSYMRHGTWSKRYRTRKIVLIFGNEITGLPKTILNKADKILEIPMRGAMVRHKRHPRRSGIGKESLNVAVAFGVVIFNILRDEQ